MGLDPVTIEISSDEEEEIARKPESKFLEYDPSTNWLIDMLELAGDPLIPRASAIVKCSKRKSDEQIRRHGSDSDDDCKILEGDPDELLKPVKGDALCSDELAVVGEKGQVACRDFPHPRHLCANFPFKTTSASKFCKMCHCYVCDIPAPCTNWATHCRSTDQEEKWVSERRHLRRLKNEPQTQPAAYTPAAHVMAEPGYVHTHLSLQFVSGVAPPPRPPHLSAEAAPYYPSYHSPPLYKPFHKQQTLQQCLASSFHAKRPRTSVYSHHMYPRRRQPMQPNKNLAMPVPATNYQPYVVPCPGLLAPAGRESQQHGAKETRFPEQGRRPERNLNP